MKSAYLMTENSRHRRRITTACLSCRERRVKCTRDRPICLQCSKGARDCRYTNDSDKSQSPVLEFVTEHLEPRRTAKNSPGSASTSALSSSVSASASGLSAASTPVVVKDTSAPTDTWRSVFEQHSSLVRRAAADGAHPPVWVFAEAEELKGTNTTRLNEYPAIQPTNPLTLLGENLLSAVAAELPSRATCEPLFESFLRGVYPLVPVCHIGTLKQEYINFWEYLSPNTTVEVFVLVLAVLYTGAANMSPCDIELSLRFYRLYESIMDEVDIAVYHVRNVIASTQLLQGYIIMNTFKGSQVAPFSAFGFLSVAIRFAQTLRLYVERKGESAVQAEVRRRIWWMLLFLDVEATVSNGLPTIMRPTGYNTELPSMVDDEHYYMDGFHKLPGPTDPSSGSNFSPIMVALQGHFHWAHRMQTWFERMPSQEEVLSFKALILSLIKLIPAENTDGDAEWARTYLQLQIDRAYCMFGLRFWRLEQFDGTGCDSEVVSTARSFLSKYLALSENPHIPYFQWYIPGFVQPLHALIILLMHISNCSNLEEEKLRSRDLIDRVMTLRVMMIRRGSMLPAKAMMRNNTPGMHSQADFPRRGNPRYTILVTLRKRVWREKGWEIPGKEPWSEQNKRLAMANRTGMDVSKTAASRKMEPWGSAPEQMPIHLEPPREVPSRPSPSAQAAQVAAQENTGGQWMSAPLTESHVSSIGPHGGFANELVPLSTPYEMDSSPSSMELMQWDQWESLAAEFFLDPQGVDSFAHSGYSTLY